MTDKWIINSAKTVGRSHIRENIPCQDSVASLQNNGVSVIALSDGCSSAPLSHYGSEMTVKVLCRILTDEFDSIYDGDEVFVKKHIIATIIQEFDSFLKKNADLVQKEINKAKLTKEQFAKFWNKHFTYEESCEYYPFTFLYATLQFVAPKVSRPSAFP